MTPRIPQEHWAGVAELYTCFRDGLVAFATRLLGDDHQMAHDLVQETFKDAAMTWETLRAHDEGRRRAWLYRVVKNKVFDQWGRARRTGVGLAGHEVAADLDTPRTAVSHLLLRRCWKVIDGMPSAQRRVALLKWQGEWTSREISDHLDIAQSTVRVHLWKARTVLAAELGDEVVFPSEWRESPSEPRQSPSERRAGQGEEAHRG